MLCAFAVTTGHRDPGCDAPPLRGRSVDLLLIRAAAAIADAAPNAASLRALGHLERWVTSGAPDSRPHGEPRAEHVWTRRAAEPRPVRTTRAAGGSRRPRRSRPVAGLISFLLVASAASV
jgi:hypothetical protein